MVWLLIDATVELVKKSNDNLHIHYFLVLAPTISLRTPLLSP